MFVWEQGCGAFCRVRAPKPRGPSCWALCSLPLDAPAYACLVRETQPAPSRHYEDARVNAIWSYDYGYAYIELPPPIHRMPSPEQSMITAYFSLTRPSFHPIPSSPQLQPQPQLQLQLRYVASHWQPRGWRRADQLPCVVYMHGNSSARVEALPQLSLALSLGATLVAFDFAGSGRSGGEYVSLGYYERDDLKVK